MILQADNGKEFSGAATASKQQCKDSGMIGKRSLISDELLADIVSEIRNLSNK
jgi:hypothetical protein